MPASPVTNISDRENAPRHSAPGPEFDGSLLARGNASPKPNAPEDGGAERQEETEPHSIKFPPEQRALSALRTLLNARDSDGGEAGEQVAAHLSGMKPSPEKPVGVYQRDDTSTQAASMASKLPVGGAHSAESQQPDPPARSGVEDRESSTLQQANYTATAPGSSSPKIQHPVVPGLWVCVRILSPPHSLLI
jgi:hypothetical protein